MRRILRVLLLFFLALMLCACTRTQRSEAQKVDTVTTISDELIRCLSEKDRDGFEGLFCEQARSDQDFETQIDAVFAFFEADNYTRAQYLQIDWSPDTRDHEAFSASVVYIQAPKRLEDGTPWHWFFELQFDCVLSNPADETLVGIQKLSIIRSNDGLTFKIGTQE